MTVRTTTSVLSAPHPVNDLLERTPVGVVLLDTGALRGRGRLRARPSYAWLAARSRRQDARRVHFLIIPRGIAARPACGAMQ